MITSVKTPFSQFYSGFPCCQGRVENQTDETNEAQSLRQALDKHGSERAGLVFLLRDRGHLKGFARRLLQRVVEAVLRNNKEAAANMIVIRKNPAELPVIATGRIPEYSKSWAEHRELTELDCSPGYRREFRL